MDALLPYAFARRHLILQDMDEEGALLWHAEKTAGLALLNAQIHVAGKRMRTKCHPDPEELTRRIEGQGQIQRTTVEQANAEVPLDALDLERVLANAEKDLLQTSGKSSMMQLVDLLLFRAIQRRASDIHLQPLGEALIVRYRIDGVLDDGERLPLRLLPAISSRIKVMARLDVAESLVPQDGRTSVILGGRSIDVRVATMPTPHGERVVMRILDSAKELQGFASLGMPADIAKLYLAAAHKTSGIILVTGPTGSGKTTTLYATLRELSMRSRNIMTIEDPIEYELDSLGLPISQSQVNTKKGVTFAMGLRHILRQDPDIILVGEIRDEETARIAIQSSMTGHLVFSTLHTNDAVSAVTRLFDLGVEPYLVASSLSMVVAQRLVRRHCESCQGRGCPECNGCGFRGRTGIFEALSIDDDLRRLIQQRCSLEELMNSARSKGMTPLFDAGKRLVADGMTSDDELKRVIHA